MRNVLRFSLMFTASILSLLSVPHMNESAEQKEIQIEGETEDWAYKVGVQMRDGEGRVHLEPPHKAFVVAAEERFIDNGDGTVTDTKRKIMWQKGDNGKEVTFENAEQCCKTLRLGGYIDWRLPKPEERDTAVVIELMMNRHSRDAHAHFDLYWSSDSTALLPFNYLPSHGAEVSRVYFAREGTRAFVRAVRPLGAAKPDGGG